MKSLASIPRPIRSFLPPVAALVIALFAAPLAAQQPGARTIVLGQVIDARSKAPLAGVSVRAVEADAATVTAEDGQFRLRLPPGTYNVTVSRLGYETVLESWQVGTESLDVGILELAADAIRLQALEVTADRLERMRLATGIASNAYTETELAGSAFPNVLEFISARQSVYRVPCAAAATAGPAECVRIRGGPSRVCVVVDEGPMPGGFDVLEAFQPRDIARLNVYRGGSFIQIYTRAFMRQRASVAWEPMSVENQMIAFCRFSG